MPRVSFGAETKASAQRYFRGEVPARAIRRYGWDSSVDFTVLEPQGLAEINSDPRLRGWDLELKDDGTADLMDPPDVIQIRLMDDVDFSDFDKVRSPDGLAPAINRARKKGQVIVCDLDDDIWNIPDWSPAKRIPHKITAVNSRAYDLGVLEANIRACTACTVTTPQIEKSVKEHCGEDTPVYIVRNGIDPKDFLPSGKRHKRLRVGWMGAANFAAKHLETMLDELEILNRYDAEFVHIGWSEGTDKYCQPLYDKIPCDVVSLPWVDHQQISQWLKSCDLGIVPRFHCDFIEGQSHSSGLQWASCGVPFIASYTAEYARLSSLGAGEIASARGSWYLLFERYFEDPDWRRRRGKESQMAVHTFHGLDATGLAYDELYRKLLANR